MKETLTTKTGGGLRPPGLHNDFSDQEGAMTASALPPAFALSAGAADAPVGDGAPHQISADYLPTAWKSVGLNPEDYAHLDPVLANKIIAISVKFVDPAWTTLWKAVCAHALESLLPSIYEDFYLKMDWILDRDAESLAVMSEMPFMTSAGERHGHVELVRKGERVGMRAIVPFEGFGGNMILDPNETSTVLGRCVEATTKEEFGEAMNAPRGTNYFRFQKEFMVGKNAGGGNVLDVADKTWSWPLNNAWLQASVDRKDKIRFISDPSKASTLFKRGGTIEDGLTVTGMELGVLLHRGMAPDEETGEVTEGYVPSSKTIKKQWSEIKDEVDKKKYHEAIDHDAYQFYLGGGAIPSRSAKQYYSPEGDLVATQTNFFGGQPSKGHVA